LPVLPTASARIMATTHRCAPKLKTIAPSFSRCSNRRRNSGPTPQSASYQAYATGSASTRSNPCRRIRASRHAAARTTAVFYGKRRAPGSTRSVASSFSTSILVIDSFQI
jgi:hypothetical protein